MTKDVKQEFKVGETVKIMTKIKVYGGKVGIISSVSDTDIIVNIDGFDVRFYRNEIYKI
jgi:preprotein translocase subunit YajC